MNKKRKRLKKLFRKKYYNDINRKRYLRKEKIDGYYKINRTWTIEK